MPGFLFKRKRTEILEGFLRRPALYNTRTLPLSVRGGGAGQPDSLDPPTHVVSKGRKAACREGRCDLVRSVRDVRHDRSPCAPIGRQDTRHLFHRRRRWPGHAHRLSARGRLLVDTGFPGNGTFQSTPGDPRAARDAQRILAAAQTASISRIDTLVTTHFHADHAGGIVELSQLLPIASFVDHGAVNPEADTNVKGTLDVFARYAAVRAKGRHTTARPGERLQAAGFDAVVVSADGRTLSRPLARSTRGNTACAAALPAQEVHENPRSVGFLLSFGRFTFLDVGDLTGAPLFALACPDNLLGHVDVYLVAHHGGPDAADPATLSAFTPRVAILNNGRLKGGGAPTFAALHQRLDHPAWPTSGSSINRRMRAHNFADGRINLDEDDRLRTG